MSTMNIFDMTDLWDAAGTTFVGIKLNATDTASAAGSLLMDLQVGGVSRFSVSKNGAVTNAYPISGIGFRAVGNGNGFVASAFGSDSTGYGPYGVRLQVDNTIEWSSTTAGTTGGSLALFRDAANTLAQRNGVNAQAFRLYGTYTDGSNSRRLVMTMSAAGVAEIKPDGLGTGASGNVLHISGLPTANPGAGILWNNGGTVEVGT